MTSDWTHRQHPDPLRDLSFRAEQDDAFSSLPLLRKVGLRREKSLFTSTGSFAGLLLRWFRPNLLLCSGLLLLSVALSAQTPTVVPVAKEPHHHLVLENDYVRVLRVSIPGHDATLLHQHDLPYVYVSLGPADVINAVQGKPEAHLVMADGQVGYSRGGFAHIARTDAGSPFNNVTIELLHPQGEPRNLCEKIVEGDLGQCQPIRNPSMSGKPYFESGELQVFFTTLEPRLSYGDVARFDRLLVTLDQAELQVSSPGQPPAKLRSGEVLWLPAGGMHTITNLSASPSRYLSLLFKDTAPPKKP